MNKIFILLFAVFLHASLIDDFLAKKYKKVCMFDNIIKYSKNPKMLSIIGKACLETDRIYLLPFIVVKLKTPKYARQNALVFLTVVMEKRVVYAYFFDGLSLESFSFPKVDYILSDVFWALKNKKFTKVDDKVLIKTKNALLKVYKRGNKLFIDEYKNGKLIKRRWYK